MTTTGLERNSAAYLSNQSGPPQGGDAGMKYEHEMAYWTSRFIQENGVFQNKHYKELFLNLANEADETFLRNKIIADFGCGPRGSLSWINVPCIKIGIDVLATNYIHAFGKTMLDHGMLYINSTESIIPIPTEYLDVAFTLNAMDHVDNFSVMAEEFLRVLKKDGLFLGSFNINEPATCCEPQTLTEDIVRRFVLHYLDVESYRIAIKHPKYTYKFLLQNKLTKTTNNNEQYILWVRGRKK